MTPSSPAGIRWFTLNSLPRLEATGSVINEATRTVNQIDRSDLQAHGVRQSDRVPTPEQIESIAAAIRSGDVIVSATSAKRWARLREVERFNARLGKFDLAGRIDDDACPLPQWFRFTSE